MDKNVNLFKKANQLMPGGVNSPVRAFKAVGGNPIFIKKAKGARIFDENNSQYLDYCMSWGAIILGHAQSEINNAIKEATSLGTSYGTATYKEINFAELIKAAVPSIEKVRLVNSGTEAVMTAIRLSRAFTKRDYIIKFDGCYHGHSDSLLVNAGSGLSSFSVSSSSGIPKDLAKLTVSLPYNNINCVEKICKKMAKKVACIIVEPIAANMGVVLPANGFLEQLRRITKKYNIVLIFDEVITGFRLRYGTAQDIFGIRADLTILGKIIGAGLPIAALGGKKEIMDLLSPIGKVYQAGTLSGNPLAVSAGIKVLEILKDNKIYKSLEEKAGTLAKEFLCYAKNKQIDVSINRIGSMFSIFFTKEKVVDFKTSKNSDRKKFIKFYHSLLRNNIYLPPSKFEASFLSRAHSYKDIERTLSVMIQSIS